MNFKGKIKHNKRFFKQILYKSFSNKSVNYSEVINITKKQIKLLNQTTFKVYKIIIDNNVYYFRRIRYHNKFLQYINLLLDEYFYFSDTNLTEEEIKQIYNTLLSKNIVQELYFMGEVYDKNSKIYNFFKTKDYNIFGIDSLKRIDKKEIINLFQFLWGNILQYHLNSYAGIGKFEVINANKEICTRKMAEILGISYLIPELKIVKVKVDNDYSMIGTLMIEAKGVSPYNIPLETRKNYTINFIKDSISLNILDGINNEKDHRPGNYNVIYSDNKIYSLQAFDNDSPDAFFPTFNVNLKTYMGGGPLLNSQNIINYNIIDRLIYDKLNKINKKIINSNFSKELNYIQKYSLYKRIKKIRVVLKKSRKLGMKFYDEIKNDNEYYDYKIDDAFISYLDIFLYYDYINNDYDINKIIKKH